MADIQRLTRWAFWVAVGLLVGGLPIAAMADTYVAPYANWGPLNSVTYAPPAGHETVAAACAEKNSGSPYIYAGTITGQGTFRLSATCVNSAGTAFNSVYARTYCPWGGTVDNNATPPVCNDAPPCETGERLQDGSCFECPEGRIWNGTTCESPCQAKSGNSVGTASEWVTLDMDRVPSGNPSFCSNGCVATGQKIECTRASATTGGDYVQVGQLCSVQGPFTYTGAGCEGNIPTMIGVEPDERRWWDTGKDEKDCVASGGMPGQVNGVQVCVRPQNGETWDTSTETTTVPTKETTTNSDGTTTEKSTTTTTTTAGGKTTTTTTTTTTTKDAEGNVLDSSTETKVEEKPLKDFCKDNPTDAACVDQTTEGAFGGGCDEGFTCTGDAVQCAIAKVAHNQACAMAVGDGVLGQFEQITGFDGTAPGEGLDRKQIDVPESLHVSEIGGGSGLQDQTFVIMGRSIDVPFSVLNQYIEMLGYAIMLIAWIGAWRIIAGAF